MLATAGRGTVGLGGTELSIAGGATENPEVLREVLNFSAESDGS